MRCLASVLASSRTRCTGYSPPGPVASIRSSGHLRRHDGANAARTSSPIGVRVDLQGTKPPLWRRLELASGLFLNDLHDVIQAAFGWTDSHLHRFGSGPECYSHDTEYYLCPFDVDEGETGIPEDQVRLDEVLIEVGDKLFYTYDFGDDWQHTIRLEAIGRHEDTAPRAVCIAGRRPGPPKTAAASTATS